MAPGRVVALEGASAAGKTTAVEAVVRTTGWTGLPEAYRRITPPPSLEFASSAELLDLEARLLREDARRYSEARSEARRGETVLADTGFLGPLTYTSALVSMGVAPGTVLAPLVDLARRLAGRGAWGLADAYIYLDTPASVRSARTRADRSGPPADLARRHREVGDLEHRFYRERFAPLLGPRFVSVSGDGSGPVVARRVVDAARSTEASAPPGPLVDAVLALFGKRDGLSHRSRGG